MLVWACTNADSAKRAKRLTQFCFFVNAFFVNVFMLHFKSTVNVVEAKTIYMLSLENTSIQTMYQQKKGVHYLCVDLRASQNRFLVFQEPSSTSKFDGCFDPNWVWRSVQACVVLQPLGSLFSLEDSQPWPEMRPLTFLTGRILFPAWTGSSVIYLPPKQPDADGKVSGVWLGALQDAREQLFGSRCAACIRYEE